jgi:hypothetical protein
VIRELARRQSGNFSRMQLLAAGLTAGGIDRRLHSGSLVTRYHGVYCLAPPRQDAQALIAAAVLAGGATAVASHASAAYLWGFVKRYEPPPEISLPAGDRRPRHILTHRCQSLQPRDITRQLGVPTTTPARTALDLAPRLTHKELTRLVNDQRRDGHLRPATLCDVLERNPRHQGTTLLRPFVENPTNPTNSPFEDDFLAFVEKYGLPKPVINFPFNGRKLDAFFPEHGLIVETDGWGFHHDREAFEDDRERDADHLDHGLPTVRLTKRRFDQSPDDEAARLHRILRRLAASRPRHPQRPAPNPTPTRRPGSS